MLVTDWSGEPPPDHGEHPCGGCSLHGCGEVPAAPLGGVKWLPKNAWLRNVELYTTLQYTATGLPDARDVVPEGEREWLDDASGWVYQTGLSMPLAPLVPKQ
jgi:hypothetical protein